jgi:hypothetical protein
MTLLLINLQIKILDWWKANEIRFPILSIMAKNFLAIMATSAPIENQFSIFGNIITKNRNSVTTKTAITTILLKSWGIPELITDEPDSAVNSDESDTEDVQIF